MHADLEKLELFGVDYIFEVLNDLNAKTKYKVYVTDTLCLIAREIAAIGGGKIDIQRYYDMIRPLENNHKSDSRTAEEIVDEVIKNAGITIVEGGEN